MVVSNAYFYSPKGVLFVEGEDAATFLQGQFSQDLRISAGATAYGLWLNSKGKILGDSFVLRISEQRFLAFSYSSETAFIQANLESRIIMDEVETSLPEAKFLGVTLWGASIEAALDRLEMEVPTVGAFSSNGSVIAFWGRRGGERNLDLLVSDEGVYDALKDWLIERAVHVLDTDKVSEMALRSELFELASDILETDLPQETGLDESAVSYRKGCYIGQEVMARLKAMGQARRSLAFVLVSCIPEGEGPWKLLDEAGKRAGQLRRVLSGSAGIVGSAMLRKTSSSGPFFVDGQSESIVTAMRKGGDQSHES